VTTVRHFFKQAGEEKANRVTRRFEKMPNYSKSSPNSLQAQKAKISTTKVNVEAQNIYIKPLLKH
jgi:hypothetical protein